MKLIAPGCRARQASVAFALGALLTAVALISPSIAAGSHRPDAAYRSGHPPVIDPSSVQVDSQRRLTVTYSAPDGVTYGGSLFLDNDPRNGDPPASPDPQYGNAMYCSNISSCRKRWELDATPGTGPFTYTTESLDPQEVPAGTYYVQVETTNEDPYPSTRYLEQSNVVTVQVPAPAPSRGTGGGTGSGAPDDIDVGKGSAKHRLKEARELVGVAFRSYTAIWNGYVGMYSTQECVAEYGFGRRLLESLRNVAKKLNRLRRATRKKWTKKQKKELDRLIRRADRIVSGLNSFRQDLEACPMYATPPPSVSGFVLTEPPR